MKKVVAVIFVMWIMLEGMAIMAMMTGNTLTAWVAEVAACSGAGVLWLLGTRGGVDR